MESHGGALFHIGPVEVTSVMVTMFAITLGLTLLSFFGTRRMNVRPSGLQNFLEKCVEMLHNFIGDILGASTRRYFPFLATMFIFILLSNYVGILPFAGRMPGLSAPTSVINVTAALALCTFCLTHYAGIKQHGVGGYLKHFAKPFVFMLPLLLLDEIIRPLALTLRLFGNIFGEETVLSEFFKLVPFVVPIAIQALSLLMGFIQALVFVLLSSIYINGALEEGH